MSDIFFLRDGEPSHGQLLHNPLSLTTFTVQPLGSTSVVAFVLFIGFYGIRQAGILTLHYQSTEHFKASSHHDDGVLTEKILQHYIPLENVASPRAMDEKPFSMKSKEIGTSTPHHTTQVEPSEAKKKYAKSGLSVETATEYHAKLREIMSNEQLFINSELTLTDLADALGIHPNYVSQIINEREGKTFYDYVNELRVEEFTRKVALPKNKHLTLLAVAFDCGFNSKSSFNRCFKKVKHCSPSEFVQHMQAPPLS
jgi:AraC-like DNA-binding protein